MVLYTGSVDAWRGCPHTTSSSSARVTVRPGCCQRCHSTAFSSVVSEVVRSPRVSVCCPMSTMQSASVRIASTP